MSHGGLGLTSHSPAPDLGAAGLASTDLGLFITVTVQWRRVMRVRLGAFLPATAQEKKPQSGVSSLSPGMAQPPTVLPLQNAETGENLSL